LTRTIDNDIEEETLVKSTQLDCDNEDDEQTDDEESASEPFIIKRVPWILRVEDLNREIMLSGVKMPALQAGAPDSGDMLVEILNVPGHLFNGYINQWLRNPSKRKIEIQTLDQAGTPLEIWRLDAIPTVMGFAPIDIKDDAPWVTQVVFKVSDINIIDESTPL
jgi:hypothetical protein